MSAGMSTCGLRVVGLVVVLVGGGCSEGTSGGSGSDSGTTPLQDSGTTPLQDSGTTPVADGAISVTPDGSTGSRDDGGATVVPPPGPEVEYTPIKVLYVSEDGNDDSGDGSEALPYRTIEKGIRSVRDAGTHVVIKPGLYGPSGTSCGFGSTDDIMAEQPQVSGTADDPIVVRAETLGTVLWTQHVVLPNTWTEVGGNVWSFDYGAYGTSFPCAEPRQLAEDLELVAGVAGIHGQNGGPGPDSGRLLTPEVSLQALDAPGEWYRDTSARRLYVWTTDSRSPNLHQITFARGLLSLRIDRNNHWVFDGIHFHGAANNNIGHRWDKGPSDFVTIRRCIFSSAGDHSHGGDSTNGSHIRIDRRRGRGWRIARNVFYSSTSEMIHSGDSDALVADGTSGPPGDLYEYNEFDGTGQAAYFARGDKGDDVQPCLIIATRSGDVFRHNEIKHCSGWGVRFEWDARDFNWHENSFHHCVRGAITVDTHSTTTSGNHLVYNNLFWANGMGGGHSGLVRILGLTSGNRFYNNTLVASGRGGAAIFFLTTGGDTLGTPTDNTFINNILLNTTATNQLMVRIEAGATGNRFDHNLYLRANQTSGPQFREGGNDYADFASWQAAGQDANGLAADPALVDAERGDLRITPGSPARNKGLDLSSSFTTDFEGQDRESGAWDIGAYEVIDAS